MTNPTSFERIQRGPSQRLPALFLKNSRLFTSKYLIRFEASEATLTGGWARSWAAKLAAWCGSLPTGPSWIWRLQPKLSEPATSYGQLCTSALGCFVCCRTQAQREEFFNPSCTICWVDNPSNIIGWLWKEIHVASRSLRLFQSEGEYHLF